MRGLLALLWATTSVAEPPDADVKLRIGYGLAFERGAQDDASRGIAYGGFTPLDFSGGLSFFPVERGGIELFADRRTYAVLSGGARVGGGALAQLDSALAARFSASALSLEPMAGY